MQYFKNLKTEKLQDIKSYILQPIGEAQKSYKSPHRKRIRIIKTKTFVQISKKIRIPNYISGFWNLIEQDSHVFTHTSMQLSSK